MTVRSVSREERQHVVALSEFAAVAPPEAIQRAGLILDQNDARELMGQAAAEAFVAWDTYRTRLLATGSTSRHHPGLEQLVAHLADLPRDAKVRIRTITSETGLLSLVWDQTGAPLGLVTTQATGGARAA